MPEHFDIEREASGWSWPPSLSPDSVAEIRAPTYTARETVVWAKENFALAWRAVEKMRAELKRVENDRELSAEGRAAASRRARDKALGELEALRSKPWTTLAREVLADLRRQARPKPPETSLQERLLMRDLDAALRLDPAELRVRIDQGNAAIASVLTWTGALAREQHALDGDDWRRIDALAAEAGNPVAFTAARQVEQAFQLFTESLDRAIEQLDSENVPMVSQDLPSR